MRILGESVQSRFMELVGKKCTFPEDGYQGDYIFSIAKEILEKHGKNLNEDNDFFKGYAENFIFNHIKKTLKNLDISFDSFFNERKIGAFLKSEKVPKGAFNRQVSKPIFKRLY